MKTFDEICIECGTDKGSVHPTAHDYARHYESAFEHLKDKPIKLLEIGVWLGQSIRAWMELFPLAEIYGVDNNIHEDEWKTPGKTGRYTFVRGDQGSDEFWADFKATHGKDFDIIIDDGSHFAHHVIGTMINLWDAVKPGGFYCIEDLGVAYCAGSTYNPHGIPTQVEFLKAKVDALYLEKGMDSIRFSKELAIIKKAG